jgi:hypothetical protein
MKIELSLTAALLFGCGPTAPEAAKSGDIVTVVGTGEQATDPVSLDASGKPRGVASKAAHLDSPVDVAFDAAGRLHVIDWNGHKIRVMGDDGLLYPLIGTGLEGDGCDAEIDADGCAAVQAQVNHPTDITFAPDGSALVAAWHNSKLKAFDPVTAKLRDRCGSGARDYLGDGGPCFGEDEAQLVALDLPSSVVLDREGNVFVADQANQVIRRLDQDGIVTTVVGSCPKGGFGCPDGVGYSGDGGPATAAKLNNGFGQWVMPAGKLAFGPDGYLYIADTFNSVVRRVNPGRDGVLGSGDAAEEVIETFVGTGTAGVEGDGGPANEAELYHPTDVAWSLEGELYVADRGNHCVRRIDADGVITTVAGQCGVPGSSGDGHSAAMALLDEPFGIAFAPDGALFIADTLNHRIRKVLP